jgi:hypothetical protein
LSGRGRRGELADPARLSGRLDVGARPAAAAATAGRLAVCVSGAVFVAVAVEVALFDCVTFPSLPGLRTRTEMFEFDGLSCSAEDAAFAYWPVFASWVEDWTPEPEPLWVC